METTTTITATTATTATATEITSRARTRLRLYTALAGAVLLAWGGGFTAAAPAAAGPSGGHQQHDDHAHGETEQAGHDHATGHGDAHGVAGLLQWIGRLHPVVIHVPVGLIIGGAFAELLLILTGAPWLEGAARFCVILAALGAAVAAPLGWANASQADYAGELASVLTTHRWLGTTAAVWALLTCALSEASRRAGRHTWRPWYRLALFAAAVLIGVTGHFGGTLVFGIDYYRW